MAAICAATTALVASEEDAACFGMSRGQGKKKVTSHPSVREKVEKVGWEYSEEVSLYSLR